MTDSPVGDSDWAGLGDEREPDPTAATSTVGRLAGYFRDCALATSRGTRLFDVFAGKDAQLLDLTADAFGYLTDEGLSAVGKAPLDLAVANEANPDECSILVGALFLVGRHRPSGAASKRVCAPLVFGRARASHDLTGATFTLESELQLNLPLLADILDIDAENEDEVLLRLNHLLDVTPDVPFDDAEVGHFLASLSTGFEVPFDVGPWAGLIDVDLAEEAAKADRVRLIPSAAIFLGAQPSSLSVVRELDALASLDLADTALAALLDPADLGEIVREADGGGASSVPAVPTDWHADIEVLDLTDQQRAAVASARTMPLTVVTGPPGTGKSYAICALVIDHLLAGRTVRVTSGTRQAVAHVAEDLETIAGEFICAHTGERSMQRALADKLSRLAQPGTRPPAYSAVELAAARARYDALRTELRTLEGELMEVLGREGALIFRDAAIAAQTELASKFRLDDLADRDKVRLLLDKAQVAPDAGWMRRRAGIRSIRNARTELGAHDADADVASMAAALAVADACAEVDELTALLATSQATQDGFAALGVLRAGLLNHGAVVLAMTRSAQLAALLANPAKKRALADYAQSLKAANKQKKKALLSDVTTTLLTEAFPCWAVKDTELSQALPLKAAMFDLVVVDEASTVTLADAVPAFARGERAVVVGDPAQLRFVSFISRSAETASFARHEISLRDQVRYRFSQRSLFDVAADAAQSQASFLLDEHFRCEPHIIGFSNHEFYRDKLRIMTQQPHSAGASAIEIRFVDGQRSVLSENAREVEEAIRITGEIVTAADNGGRVQSIALLSPLRGQTNALQRGVAAAFTSEQIARHHIVTGTAHTLQGDQRDVVVISTVIDPDFHHATLRFIENPNLFNVAVTRARKRLVMVTSVTPAHLPAGEGHLLAKFFQHAANPLDPEARPDAFRSNFERQVADALRARGVKVIAAYPSCGYEIDLVAVADGRSLAIECDGHPHHFNNDGTYTDQDIARHLVLTRAGWDIARVGWSAWRSNPQPIVEWLTARLAEPATARPERTQPVLPPLQRGNVTAATPLSPTRTRPKKAPARRTAAPTGRIDADKAACTCGGRWVKRTGRYGDFYGCSHYPRCRRTKPLR
jgi:superfamily I DNA/RNA helicase/very-short-patch-repair endonuclease